MAKSRVTFPWSDDKIRKATAPRALPIYTEDEKIIRDALASHGAQRIISSRKGARKPRQQTEAVAKRRALLAAEFWCLPSALQKHPTNSNTIDELEKILAKHHKINVARDVIIKDLTALGVKRLRDSASKRLIIWPAKSWPAA